MMGQSLKLQSEPVLTCREAGEFEAGFFQGDEEKEWQAMQRAGRLLADAIRADAGEIGGLGTSPRLLVLVGKGHNGGDAVIAAEILLARFPGAHADIVFLFGERSLRPLTLRAWRLYQKTGFNRIHLLHAPESLGEAYDLVIDGIFGFQFRPPSPEGVGRWLEKINSLDARLRAAVDLPSGMAERHAFRADFTYATGIFKLPLLTLPNAGRLRHLGLGWRVPAGAESAMRILTAGTLEPLTRLRDPNSDKRTFGHLGVLGGSRHYPGAVLMTVRAALQSGCGLLTAFVPESLVTSYAAVAPEAMWIGWPETPDGSLAMEGVHLLRERCDRLTALVIGPGLGREAETLAFLATELPNLKLPVVIDADALQANIVTAGTCPRILTPHAGEFARIAGGLGLNEFVARHEATVVLKGPVTQVASGRSHYASLFGGPVLARGGSGDILSGIIGSLLAQHPDDSLGAAATGVVWQGLAADALARSSGAMAVTSTQLLPFLAAVLREPRNQCEG